MRLKRRKSKPKEGNPKAAATVQAGTLVLPRKLIVETHEYFLPYWRAGVESACFWFGVDLNDQQIVTSLALPKLYQTPGNFSVDKNSMRRLSLSMAHQGLTNLAQIHTHPSEWVEHSPFDNDRAYSTRDGALSLVWPQYGLSVKHNLFEIGVHEMRSGDWIRLSAPEVSERIHIVDSMADFRWEIESGEITHVE